MGRYSNQYVKGTAGKISVGIKGFLEVLYRKGNDRGGEPMSAFQVRTMHRFILQCTKAVMHVYIMSYCKALYVLLPNKGLTTSSAWGAETLQIIQHVNFR